MDRLSSVAALALLCACSASPDATEPPSGGGTAGSTAAGGAATTGGAAGTTGGAAGAGGGSGAGGAGGTGGSSSECTGAKARDGEPCATDVDCGAGLLCNEMTRRCRPIAGIRILGSFPPAGRDDGWSEGLDFAHGSLWQSTPNLLLRIDVASRAVSMTYPPPSAYAEGLTWNGNVLYNVSYRNGNLYAAELKDNQLPFSLVGELQMTGGCVYGIVHHCDELYTTRCAQSVVDVYTPGTTMPIKRTFTVLDQAGAPLPEVEDLEIYRGQLWTSTFRSPMYTSKLFRVDLGTNMAVASYDIPCVNVAIDGVAADPETRTLYVTGKNCPILMYAVE